MIAQSAEIFKRGGLRFAAGHGIIGAINSVEGFQWHR